MSRYTVTRRPQNDFQMEVLADDGTHHIVLGFATEAEADEWIVADRRAEALRVSRLFDDEEI